MVLYGELERMEQDHCLFQRIILILAQKELKKLTKILSKIVIQDLNQ